MSENQNLFDVTIPSELHAVDEYPIDSYPLTTDGAVRVNESGVKYLEDTGFFEIEELLSFWQTLYNVYMDQFKTLLNSEHTYNPTHYFFLVNTGFGLVNYKISSEESELWELINNQPDIAITDLDKALLGHIYTLYSNVFYTEYYPEDKELLYCFIGFFHNAQNYQYRTRSTIDIKGKIDKNHLIKVLSDPNYEVKKHSSISITGEDCEKLEKAISYRKTLNQKVLESRILERKYAMDSMNDCYWKCFIHHYNHLHSEEIRVLDLVMADIPIKDKMKEFERYLSELYHNEKVFQSDISVEDLYYKIVERCNNAPNYCWFKGNDGAVFPLDEGIFSKVIMPYSFNTLIIAYHSFLLNSSENSIKHLKYFLNWYIKVNLGDFTQDDYRGDIGSLDECLLSLSHVLFEYYDSHKTAIDSIQYEKIQTEEQLSGFDYEKDISIVAVKKHIQSIRDNKDSITHYLEENEDEFDRLIFDYANLSSDDRLSDIYQLINPIMPCDYNAMTDLFEKEKGNRLIIVVNAIYILANTIEKLLNMGLLENPEEFKPITKKLYQLERYLVKTTYVAPDINCYEKVDMEEYRLLRGIDAKEVVIHNKERTEYELLRIAKRAIKCDLSTISIQEANEIKKQYREEILSFPDCVMKELLIELIDQENNKLCTALVSDNLETDDFDLCKTRVCDYLGVGVRRLPDDAVNALVTAELLFEKYANDTYNQKHFDYSCISSLYYQSVETIYNRMIWKKYATELNRKKYNGKTFAWLYSKNELPEALKGYLPAKSVSYYYDKKTSKIVEHLTLGSFLYIIYNVTSNPSSRLIHFEEHFNSVFGHETESVLSEDYKEYKKRVDELYLRIKDSVPKRNAASHGETVISLEDCITDKHMVLSDIESIRKESLGIIQLFLSIDMSFN